MRLRTIVRAARRRQAGFVETLPAFTFATETNTLIAARTAAGTTPNARRQYTLDRMVKRLKAQGIFSKLTALWVIGEGDAASRINLVNPGTYNLTVNGAPTFTSNVGWSFATISDFFDTGIVANATSTNNISMGYFGKAASTTSYDMGAQATGVAIYLKNNTVQAALNGALANPLGGASGWWDGLGMVAVSRTASTGYTGYHCGIAVTATVDASTAPTSTLTLTVGKVNGQTAANCKRVIQGAFVGQGLTSTEMEQLHAIVQTAIDSIEYGDLAIYEAGYAPSAPAKFDLIVYGATFAGVTAAHRAAQLGLNVAIVGGWRERSIGGMTSGGLGLVDYDVSGAIGGVTYDVVKAARTVDASALTRNTTVGSGPTHLLAQPRSFKGAMHSLLDASRTTGLGYLQNGQNVPIFWSNGVATATKTGATITGMTTVDGRTFTADYFIDTSEEFDLGYCAGLSNIIGREAASSGSEVLNGYRGATKSTGSNGTQIENASSLRLAISNAYVTPGDSASGLIYGLVAKPTKNIGDADNSVMSYTFRQTHNNNQARRVNFSATPPPGYLASKYELFARAMADYPTAAIATIMKLSQLPNTTTDTNNTGGISFNLVGSGLSYTACESAGTRAQVYAAREVVQKDIESWVRGLIYFILYSGDSRIPAGIVTSLQAYGWDSRHYLDPHPNDTLYWPTRLYVREHRRMIGDFILDANDVTKTDATTPRSVKTVSTISYRFDSHPHIRFADDTSSTIFCEGSIDIAQSASGGSANGTDGITPVPYEAYLSKAAEATNFAATFAMSSTHIAMTAARMELTTAQAAESLAYAVNIAKANSKQALKDVDYPTLRTAILAAPTSFPASLQQIN
jgi:hypothetical protein